MRKIMFVGACLATLLMGMPAMAQGARIRTIDVHVQDTCVYARFAGDDNWYYIEKSDAGYGAAYSVLLSSAGGQPVTYYDTGYDGGCGGWAAHLRVVIIGNLD
jgi:hypothetical protein